MIVAHLTDLHGGKRDKVGNAAQHIEILIARAVARVMSLVPLPDCVIISGDIADQGRPSDYQMVHRLLSPLTMPIYLIPGNHDNRAAMKAVFCDYPFISQNDGHIDYVVDQWPLRIIALDSLVEGKAEGALGAEQLDWLELVLAAEPAKPTMIMVHHPPFHVGMRGLDKIGLIVGAQRLHELVARHRQVERILCGHVHRMAYVAFAGAVASTGPSIAHQSLLNFDPSAKPMMILEPAAFQLHLYSATDGLVSHLVYVDQTWERFSA